MKTLFFSVIIPTLNEERFLPNLLEDLSKQKYKNFEVIVVDGNSEDKTKEIVRSESRMRIRLEIIDQKNVSVQRNTGARSAVGEYILFIDADSRIDTLFLKKAHNHIRKSNFLIYLPAMIPDRNKASYGTMITLGNYAVDLSQSTSNPFSNSGTFLIQRHFFNHLGGFDPSLKLAEDHDIIKRARASGVHAKFLHDLTFTFSLRRFEKEGLLKLLMKYTMGTFYTLTNQRIDKEIFSYEMGGLRYDEVDKHKNLDEFKNLYNSVRKTIEETFK